MHNNSIQSETCGHKGENAVVNNYSYKAFVEELKKQLLSDRPSTKATADETDDTDDEEKLKAAFNKLFANLDDD